nr:DsbC family protein [Wenzhouxiangella sp. XN79A]
MPADAQDYQVVRDRLESLTGPETEITIAESAIPGVLQVRLGGDIVYMSEDGRYLMQGRLLDLESRTDLTNAAKTEIRKDLVQAIDTEQLIRFGPDNPEYELLVFTDVDCGYCRRLHQQISEYTEAGIRINYLAFPRAGAGSETFRKMDAVWCSDDQHAAMDEAKAGGSPTAEACQSPVAEQYRLGQALGVTGTPALLTMDGDLIPGYVPADDLRGRLEQLAAQHSAD